MSYHSRQPSVASSLLSAYNHTHPQKIGPWKLGKTLGRGATGRVLLATHTTTGQKAAVKVVLKLELQDENEPPRAPKDPKDGGLPYGIEREIIIMKLLTHPNVLRLYDVWETSKALYLVLEYVEGGELFDLLVERGPLQEIEAVKYFRQIILGTAYCHALGICHRDLKPENLLLDASLNVKLADFGMAALESNGKLLETSCGSPHYAAPEIVSGLKYHGAASDVWSCGVILFALLTGRLPFDDENIRNLLLKVQAGSYEMAEELSEEAKDLIDHMLTVNPMKRIPTERILQHPLLLKYPIPNEDLISVKSLPHPETAYKSLGSAKNIDPQILQNLLILWHDRPQKEIIDCLLKKGTNPEKTFYALLLRYRHDQFDQLQNNSPARSTSISRSTSSRSIHGGVAVGSTGAGKRRLVAQISRSSSRNKPVLFQYKNAIRTSGMNIAGGRISASPSVHSSPRRSPKRNLNYSSQSPRKSPKRNLYASQSPKRNPPKSMIFESKDDVPAIPRNIYNEIVAAQGQGISDTGIPIEKDLGKSVDAISSVPAISSSTLNQTSNLMESAKIATSKSNKRFSTLSNSVSKNRLLRRKSMRASMTTGLKRNSITMKLLSTYAKLAGETDWEYVDKQLKRTSATFASLCDKIFNQEDYQEEDAKLRDEEQNEAKEYEKIMEQERKKHEAELRARKELAKYRKRQKRKSLLSSKKLSIFVKEDNEAEGREVTVDPKRQSILEEPPVTSSKRKSNRKSLRTVSEIVPKNEDILTKADVENFKRRSVTQPTKTRPVPNLARRPVSRLDPLWTNFESDELDRAQDMLYAEFEETKSTKLKNSNTEEHERSHKNEQPPRRLYSKDEYYNKETAADYELPEPTVEKNDLSAEYMSEIRKSRLLNSQLSIKGNLDKGKSDNQGTKHDSKQQTLIGNVKIPTVTRKSRCFTNSNKRLSVLTMYSTKESYRDLNLILQEGEDLDEDQDLDEDADGDNGKGLRTSFAHRFDKNSPIEEKGDYSGDEEVVDFNDLNTRRASYYNGASGKKQLQQNSRRQSSKSSKSRPQSELPKLPTKPYNMNTVKEDDTFATKDESHNEPIDYLEKGIDSDLDDDDMEFIPVEDDEDAALFDQIKLPEKKADKTANVHTEGEPRSKSNRNTISLKKASMLIPDSEKFKASIAEKRHVTPAQVEHAQPEPYRKVRKAPNDENGAGPQKKPLEDSTNKPSSGAPGIPKKKSGSIFRKLSWGSKKSLEQPENIQLPSPAASRNASSERKSSNSFFRWLSGNHESADIDVKRFKTILPKQEINTALFALLNSWSNFGLTNLKNDTVAYNITGAISSYNSFNLKSCKFRIKINGLGQKSEIVCAKVKGSSVTSDTLFKEIERVLVKEGVMDH